MKKKILLLNYLIWKCVQKEQQLLGIDDFRAGMLSFVLSHANKVRRYAYGVGAEEICFAHIYFPEEVLLAVCLDAELHGDKLLHEFDFHKGRGIQGKYHREIYIKDDELDGYLESIFPYTNTEDDVEFKLYKKATNFSRKKLLERAHRVDNLCCIPKERLALPEKCAETDAIDRALERLHEDELFNCLFGRGYKHNPMGRSLALYYCFKNEYKGIIKDAFGE